MENVVELQTVGGSRICQCWKAQVSAQVVFYLKDSAKILAQGNLHTEVWVVAGFSFLYIRKSVCVILLFLHMGTKRTLSLAHRAVENIGFVASSKCILSQMKCSEKEAFFQV